MFDGGNDIHTSLALSGEPIAPQLEIAFGPTPSIEKRASETASTNIKLREYKSRYLDYWNSTSTLTGTGRPVDAFISPIAPFAAPLPQQYTHNAYTTVVNVLDYAAAALPVTLVDKAVDKVELQYQPLNPKDWSRHQNCGPPFSTVAPYMLTTKADDPELYHGAHVGVQVVAGRLQEEKVIALAEYLDSLLHRV